MVRVTHVYLHSNRRRTWPGKDGLSPGGVMLGLQPAPQSQAARPSDFPSHPRDDGPIWRGHSADASEAELVRRVIGRLKRGEDAGLEVFPTNFTGTWAGINGFKIRCGSVEGFKIYPTKEAAVKAKSNIFDLADRKAKGHDSSDAPPARPVQREQHAHRLITECLQRLSSISLDFDPEAERLLDKAEMALEAIRERFKRHG